MLAGPLNFTLPAGQRVVLVGTSGSGKSSLINALSVLWLIPAHCASTKPNCAISIRAHGETAQLGGAKPRSCLPRRYRKMSCWLARMREDGCNLFSTAHGSAGSAAASHGVDTVIGATNGLSWAAQRVAVARALLNPIRVNAAGRAGQRGGGRRVMAPPEPPRA